MGEKNNYFFPTSYKGMYHLDELNLFYILQRIINTIVRRLPQSQGDHGVQMALKYE